MVEALTGLMSAVARDNERAAAHAIAFRTNPTLKPFTPLNPVKWIASYLMQHNPKAFAAAASASTTNTSTNGSRYQAVVNSVVASHAPAIGKPPTQELIASLKMAEPPSSVLAVKK